MSKSRRKRQSRNRKNNTIQKDTMQKSTDLGSWSPLSPWLVNDGEKFYRNKWSAAKAYTIIGYVEKCVELIASGITSLPYTIKRFGKTVGANGKWDGVDVARSDDPVPRHPLFQMFYNYENDNYMSLIFRIAASMTLFDELFIELIRKSDKYPVGMYNPLIGLDWLNPLGVSIDAYGGQITRYFYSPFDTATPATYLPHEIAYKHGYNPEDDLRGYPDVLAIIESLEIDASIQTAVVSHFRNGIQPGGIVSPKDGMGNLQAAREGMGDAKVRSRGPENVGNLLYWPKSIDYTATPYPDYSQITAYAQDTGDRILDQFGVPRAVLGNSDIAGYKQGDDVTYRFYVTNIIPRADDIVKFFNRRIIPLLLPEYHMDRLVVDRSEFDRVSENDLLEADIAGKNLQASIITINEARKRQGLEEFEPERGDLLIVPVGTIFVSPNDLRSGFIAGGTPEEAAVATETSDIESNNDIENALQNMPGTDGTPGSQEAQDEFFEREEKQDELNKSIGGIKDFTESEHLRDESGQFTSGGGQEGEEKDKEKQLNGSKYHLSHIKSVMAKSLSDIEQWNWTIDKAHKELDTIYTFIRRRGSDGLKHLPEFNFNYTRGDISDVLLKTFENYDKEKSDLTVKAVFEKIKEWVAVKAIQATRIDFEDGFEDILQAYIDKKITTQQFSTRVRSLIRKSCNKAYRDGLSDGGAVEEEPTDAEQVEINQFIAEQSQYVTSMIDSVKSDKYESSEGKGLQWYNKSVKPMYDAGLASAAGDMMVEWVLGRTERHCRSCLGYNGQRHRFKTWLKIGAMPGSDTLACSGFNCDCKLAPARGKASGKLKLIKSIFELMGEDK